MKNVLKVDDTDILSREANIFGSYLIHNVPHDEAVGLYIKALQTRPGDPSRTDQKRLDFVRRHAWVVRFLDPGLALADPSSEVRRRIYIMFSILEAVPQYHRHFLPKDRKRWYFFVVGVRGAWGLAKALFGTVLVRLVK